MLVGGFGFLEQRLHELEQLARAGVRLRLGGADDGALDLVRKRVEELRSRLLRADDDDLRRVQPPDGAFELRGNVLQVLGDELLEVPLMPRLGNAALVVASGLILRAVDDLFEPPGPEAKDLAALAADERDDRAVVAADELRERRQVEARGRPVRRPARSRRRAAGGRSRRTRRPRTRVHLPG